MKTLIITPDDVRHIVSQVGLDKLMDEMIGRLESGIMKYNRSLLSIPPRDGFEYEEPNNGLLEWMPIYKRGEKVTCKVVGYHPSNPKQLNVPTVLSSISIYDTVNGHLTAVADGKFLTALRTGAASAVASKLLGHPDSRVIGIIGCGAQAVSQLHALSRVLNLKTVLIYDVDLSASNSFKERTGFVGLDVQTAKLQELVYQSDIIVTATSVVKGKGPVFQDGKVKPWLHINAVGSDFKGKFEIPISLLKRSTIVPDFLAQAVVEGECQQLHPQDIGPNIVKIVQNQKEYQSLKNKLSVFDSTGWAFEDQIAMEILIKHTNHFRRGVKVQIESDSTDPKNPYEFLIRPSAKSTNNVGDYTLRQWLKN